MTSLSSSSAAEPWRKLGKENGAGTRLREELQAWDEK